MNDKHLTTKQRITIASMLFGLFFGAGNVIFPIAMGQKAGSHLPLAVLGFIVTAVGIPFLAIIAIGITRSQSVFQLASRVSKGFAYLFTILLYLTIGPLFATPRLATVSFEVGLAPYFSSDQLASSLWIYSAIFFALVLYFSWNPSKIVERVGKYLNPTFLVLMGMIIIWGLVNMSGSLHDFPAYEPYSSQAFAAGFIDGYNTMDGLAGLAFGLIIIQALQSFGIESPRGIAKESFISGILSMTLMALIYFLLSLLGTYSLAYLPEISANGGQAMALITQNFFGQAGQLILAVTMFFACFKTAIGLVVALSETFSKLFPAFISQKAWAVIASLVSFFIANVGLNTIIALSLPVLMFLYPLAIGMIVAAFLPQSMQRRGVYQILVAAVTIPAIFDFIKASPAILSKSSFGLAMTDFASTYLPLFDQGLAWLGFLVLGLIVSVIYVKVNAE